MNIPLPPTFQIQDRKTHPLQDTARGMVGIFSGMISVTADHRVYTEHGQLHYHDHVTNASTFLGQNSSRVSFLFENFVVKRKNSKIISMKPCLPIRRYLAHHISQSSWEGEREVTSLRTSSSEVTCSLAL